MCLEHRKVELYDLTNGCNQQVHEFWTKPDRRTTPNRQTEGDGTGTGSGCEPELKELDGIRTGPDGPDRWIYRDARCLEVFRCETNKIV